MDVVGNLPLKKLCQALEVSNTNSFLLFLDPPAFLLLPRSGYLLR